MARKIKITGKVTQRVTVKRQVHVEQRVQYTPPQITYQTPAPVQIDTAPVAKALNDLSGEVKTLNVNWKQLPDAKQFQAEYMENPLRTYSMPWMNRENQKNKKPRRCTMSLFLMPVKIKQIS